MEVSLVTDGVDITNETIRRRKLWETVVLRLSAWSWVTSELATK